MFYAVFVASLALYGVAAYVLWRAA